MGACMQSVGGDCWECFDPDDAAGGEGPGSKEAAMLRCSYALDLGNARWEGACGVICANCAWLVQPHINPFHIAHQPPGGLGDAHQHLPVVCRAVRHHVELMGEPQVIPW